MDRLAKDGLIISPLEELTREKGASEVMHRLLHPLAISTLTVKGRQELARKSRRGKIFLKLQPDHRSSLGRVLHRETDLEGVSPYFRIYLH